MLKSGILVCVLGFGMVFVVLALLILMINLISWATRKLVKDKPEQEAAPAAAPVSTAGATDLTPEALAAVTAALAKALDKDAGQLIIRNVTRV